MMKERMKYGDGQGMPTACHAVRETGLTGCYKHNCSCNEITCVACEKGPYKQKAKSHIDLWIC